MDPATIFEELEKQELGHPRPHALRSTTTDPPKASDLDPVRTALGSVLRGKPEPIELLLTAVVAGGHVLIEDVPGVGKTTLAKALSRVFAVGFSRVQFTPDLLPSDIVGSHVLDPKDGSFSFQAGPIFTNVFLADEINRASPRTQSALLEAMNEEQVTVEGTTRALPKPFLVLATQNPIDFQGTYPLPEAQLDRFLVRLKVGYPETDAELTMLLDRRTADPLSSLRGIVDAPTWLGIQRAARNVEVKDSVSRYLLQIVQATRRHKDLALGCSPRGSLALYRASQARAFLSERAYVTPDDIQALALPVLGHRIQLTQTATYEGVHPESLIRDVLEGIRVPT